MKSRKDRLLVSVGVVIVLLVAFGAAACGRADAPSVTAAAALPTVDTEKVIEGALASAEAEFSEHIPAAEPTLDVEQLKSELLDELESRMRLSMPTAQPTPNTDEIAAQVLEKIDPQIEDVLIGLYERVNPAVVLIEVPPFGSGSGFVYDEEGHIVTNNHVVEVGSVYEVIFSSGQRVAAELVGSDIDSDLAVIKVDSLPLGVVPLELAEAGDIRPGQFVIAIGNPFGEQGSMSLGIVSGLGRSLRSQRGDGFAGGYALPQVIQTDAPINPGNSGGPLLNLRGEVIGINAAIATRTGANSGVGFSIPVAAVSRIAPSLIEDGAYEYPYIGAGFDDQITLEERTIFDLPQTWGAYVVSVSPESPAEEAGLIPADPRTARGGDLIVKIDDQEIKDFSDLNSYLVFQTTVGQTIRINVLRNGKEIQIPLTLGARP